MSLRWIGAPGLDYSAENISGRRRHACRPCAATAVKFLHRRHAQGLGIVPQNTMEGSTLSVLGCKCHWVILSVVLGLGLRQHLDRALADQAGVELILRVKIRQAPH